MVGVVHQFGALSLERVRAAEAAIGHLDGPFAEGVARYYFKLFAHEDEYEATVARLLVDATFTGAVEIATLPDLVRGYEHVKLRSVVDYRERVAAGLRALDPAAG